MADIDIATTTWTGKGNNTEDFTSQSLSGSFFLQIAPCLTSITNPSDREKDAAASSTSGNGPAWVPNLHTVHDTPRLLTKGTQSGKRMLWNASKKERGKRRRELIRSKTPRPGRLKEVKHIIQRATAREAPALCLDAHALSHNQCPADLVVVLINAHAVTKCRWQ